MGGHYDFNDRCGYAAQFVALLSGGTSSGGGLNGLLRTGSWDGVISPTTLPNLDLVYSNDPDALLQQFVRDEADGRFRLRILLQQLSGYDVVLIDTQGAVGVLQESAMLAADVLLSPQPTTTSVSNRLIMTGKALAAVLLRLVCHRYFAIGYPFFTPNRSSIPSPSRMPKEEIHNLSLVFSPLKGC